LYVLLNLNVAYVYLFQLIICSQMQRFSQYFVSNSVQQILYFRVFQFNNYAYFN